MMQFSASGLLFWLVHLICMCESWGGSVIIGSREF